LGHKNFDGEDGALLASDALQSAELDIDWLERALGPQVAENAASLRRRLQRQHENLRLASDADTHRSITEEARLIRQEVARLRTKPEFVNAAIRSEIDEFVEAYSVEVLPLVDPKTNMQIQRLAGHARETIQRGGPHAAEDAKHSYDEMRSLVIA